MDGMKEDAVQPIALCVEYLGVRSRSERYMCCVATPGYDVALGLDAGGDVVWREDARLAFELWVSADHQLMVVRRAGRPEIVVSRAGRSLSLPFDKPVVLLDCDRVEIGGRAMRVHVHGPTETVVPPEPLEPARSTRPIAALATAVAISASAIGCKPSVEGSDTPSAAVVPEVVPPPADSAGPSTDAEVVEDSADAALEAAMESPSASASSAVLPPSATKKPPIEVRTRPPKPVTPRRDSGVPF
jgi:hypothetical protein